MVNIAFGSILCFLCVHFYDINIQTVTSTIIRIMSCLRELVSHRCRKIQRKRTITFMKETQTKTTYKLGGETLNKMGFDA